MLIQAAECRAARKVQANQVAVAVSLAACLGFLSQAAHAVEPGNVRVGPVNITPTVEADTRYIDNLYRTRNDEVSTWATQVAPEVQAWVQAGPNLYSLSYEIVNYRYFSRHQEDFTDHKVNLDVNHEFTHRHKINVGAEYLAGHEESGTGLSEGLSDFIDEPVEFDRSRAGLEYTFGSEQTAGKLVLAGKVSDLEYGNFRQRTRYFDRTREDLSTTFFYKVAPRTDVLAEVRYMDHEYDRVDAADPGGSLDSEEINYFLGVEWKATASTNGSIRLGSYDRSYDSSERSDDDGFNWEIGLTYWPRTYSRFDLSTKRYSLETNGLGDFINTRQYGVDWNHDWGGRSSTFVSAVLLEEEYSGANRDDDLMNLELGYKYAARRWLDLGMGYRLEDRDSTLGRFDYTRNTYYLELELSL